jgi:tetratricopeptide (TPR) repeat protein
MNKKYLYLVLIFLTVASFIAYGRILGNGFINFDDTAYITQNSHIQSGFNLESIKWALSSSVQNYYWHPLTWFSHMLDWSLFKDKAGGHHLVSLLLHLGSAIFLFFFLYRTTKNIWPAAFAASLFALHPLRLESVAWAAERKDVLSMFLGMISIYAYALYAENTRISRYSVCLILFALCLTAKPTMVTLPFVLLLLDYWPLGRWQKALTPAKAPAVTTETVKNKKRKATSIAEQKISTQLTNHSQTIRHLLWEKAPFILLAIVSGILTYWGQYKSGLVASAEDISLAVRFQNATVSYVSFLWKTIWPVDLAVWYPYEYILPFWQSLFFFIILIGITVAVIVAMKKLPFLFVGWFWYLGTLFPMIGLVQLSTQARSDRFSYLPSIGIAIIMAWGIPYFFPREKIRKIILFPSAIAVLSILVVLTWHQCSYWKNSIELWNYCLRVTKDNSQAYFHLGLALAEEGKIKEAVVQYNKGISITPDFRILMVRGNSYSSLGQYNLAIEDYNEVIRLNTDLSDVYYRRGNAYSALGQFQIAIGDFNEAILREPEAAIAYYSRGNAYSEIKQYQMAIEDYNKAIRLKPDFTEAYFNRGNAYVRGQSHYELAIKDYNEAIRLKPDFIEAYFNKGGLLINQGNKKMGCLDLLKACALGNCKVMEAAKSKGYCL